MKIATVEQFIQSTRADSAAWGKYVWFRGEPDKPTRLIPKLYRDTYDENELLQNFRRRAPILAASSCPSVVKFAQLFCQPFQLQVPPQLRGRILIGFAPSSKPCPR
jgi:hypothetical protein